MEIMPHRIIIDNIIFCVFRECGLKIASALTSTATAAVAVAITIIIINKDPIEKESTDN